MLWMYLYLRTSILEHVHTATLQTMAKIIVKKETGRTAPLDAKKTHSVKEHRDRFSYNLTLKKHRDRTAPLDSKKPRKRHTVTESHRSTLTKKTRKNRRGRTANVRLSKKRSAVKETHATSSTNCAISNNIVEVLHLFFSGALGWGALHFLQTLI